MILVSKFGTGKGQVPRERSTCNRIFYLLATTRYQRRRKLLVPVKAIAERLTLGSMSYSHSDLEI